MRTLRISLVGVVFALLLGAVLCPAQTAPTAPTRNALPDNIYAFGFTVNPNASPVGSGTAMYGRLLDTKGTYAIAVLDAVPTTTAPYTVTTNPSAGVAQLFLNNGNLKVFATPSAGLSYTGTNTGYSYALGGLATYDISPKYAVGFGGRLFKSNVSNSGYQPSLSVEFILKQ